MKRQIIVGLSILAMAAVVGWKVGSHQEASTGLKDIRLIQHSEHAHAGPTEALAGIRIRLSPSDFDDTITTTAHEVPQIALAAE